MNPLSLDQKNNLVEAFFAIASELPDGTAYAQSVIQADHPDKIRIWEKTSYRETFKRVLTIAAYLRKIGVTVGSRVAVISSTRPEWMEADLAIQSLGGVTVSIYQSVTAHDVGYILYDSEVQYVFAENQEQVDKLLLLLSGPIDIPATENRQMTSAQIGLRRIITFEACNPHPLVVSIKDLEAPSTSDIPSATKSIKREDLASLVYTSGTTGPPKGVMQTHGNHLANIRQAFQSGIYQSDSSIMLFLPLAHAFAKLMGYIGLLTPAVIKFPCITDTKSSKPNAESVTRDIREANASIVLIVPRLLEKMESGIRSKASRSGLSASLLRRALNAQRGSFEYFLTNFIRRKICRTLFGSQFKYAVSGGAKLSTNTAKFFDHLGIPILQGYGLTETVVATNVNRFATNQIGTVGPVLASDIEMKVTEEGEICYRGPNVAAGYLNRPEATAAAWDAEGWFHTGDLGSIAADGFLTITGRKKELIVTSNGKKIAPETIEQKIKASYPLISQILMYGEARSSNVALVTINPEVAEQWAKNQGIELGQVSKNSALKAEIKAHIEKINKELSNFEAVHKISIIDEDFSIENGLMTPTFKVKRNAVYKKYEREIAELYSNGPTNQ